MPTTPRQQETIGARALGWPRNTARRMREPARRRDVKDDAEEDREYESIPPSLLLLLLLLLPGPPMLLLGPGLALEEP